MLHACSYTICFEFCYTSWHLYAFSRTNLLTRCHSASSQFFAIFVFQKSYTGNILGIGQKKIRTSYFYRSFMKTKEETEGGQPHHRAVRPAPGPCPLVVRPPWSTPDAAPSPIKTPRREKPKHPINFLETHRDTPPLLTRDREGLEALSSTLPERGITTVGLLHHHACLWRDELVVYLGLWVHSSS
jgi:hypothetical protein